MVLADLHALHDGALEADHAAALKGHVAGCAACEAEVAFLSRVRGAMEEPEAPPPPRAWERIAARAGAARPRAAAAVAWAGVAVALAAVCAWLALAAGDGEASADPWLAELTGEAAPGPEVSDGAALNFVLGGDLEEPTRLPAEAP
jgi:anti-sigma factor RsiW